MSARSSTVTHRSAAQARGPATRIGYSTAREYLDRIRVKYVEVGRPAPTKVDLLRRAVEDGILPGLTRVSTPTRTGAEADHVPSTAAAAR